MLPFRLVIDTNVVISAAMKRMGLQRTVLTIALAKPARWYVSRPILDEYREVLSRPELQINKGLRQQFLQLVKNRGHMVVPSRRLAAATDPDGNIFLECADPARADFLITGNQKHFPRYWKQTKVMSPREFVSLIAPHLTA